MVGGPTDFGATTAGECETMPLVAVGIVGLYDNIGAGVVGVRVHRIAAMCLQEHNNNYSYQKSELIIVIKVVLSCNCHIVEQLTTLVVVIERGISTAVLRNSIINTCI